MRDVTRNPAAVEPPALSRRLLDILSLEDLEPAAERYLPHCIFSFISGAVETNASRHENRAAFQDYDFHPRVLVDVSARTTAKTLFGETFSAPFGIAPMGGSGLAGYRADLALASAAAAENVPFILSGASLVRLEEIASANPQAWFQAYLPVERARHRRADRSRCSGRLSSPRRHRRCSGRRQSRKSGACRLYLAAAPDTEACARRAEPSALAVRHRTADIAPSRHALLREFKRRTRHGGVFQCRYPRASA